MIHPLVVEYERQHPNATLRLRACGHWEGVPVPAWPTGTTLEHRIQVWFQCPEVIKVVVAGPVRERRNDANDICGLCADRYETQRVMRLEAGVR